MDIKDVSRMALEGEFLSAAIDEFLDLLIDKNNLIKPTNEEIQGIKQKVLKRMQIKYPNAGIILTDND